MALDLASNTRLVGSLPSCLSDLTKLNSLRITDVGLIGEVPSGLCAPRPMNGLSSNAFGCDAVACAVGTFRRGSGRQVSRSTPCIPCEVPSNVLGSTICQWVHEADLEINGINGPSVQGVPSLVPSFFPSIIPTKMPSKAPSPRPSPSPFLPNAKTSKPSALEPLTRFSSLWPSQEPDSHNPTIINTGLTQSPVSKPGSKPGSNPVDGIVAEQTTLPNSAPRGQAGVIGAALSAGAIVILAALLLLRRKHRHFESSESEIIEATASEPLDEAEIIDCLPQQSLSTIEEEDSELGVPSTSPPSASTDNSIHKSSSVSANTLSPPSISEVSSPRRHRVRFTLPDPIPWSYDDSDEGDAKSLTDARDQATQMPVSSATAAELWASWIMNPFLVAPGLCASDNQQVGSSFEVPLQEDEQSLSPSHSSTTSQTPMLPKKECVSSDFYHGLDAESREPDYFGVSFCTPFTSSNGLCASDNQQVGSSYEAPLQEDEQSLSPSTTSQTPMLPQNECVSSDFYYGLDAESREPDYFGVSFCSRDGPNDDSPSYDGDNASAMAVAAGYVSSKPPWRKRQQIESVHGAAGAEERTESDQDEKWPAGTTPEAMIEI